VRWPAADFDYRCRSRELAGRASRWSITVNLGRSRAIDKVTSQLRHSDHLLFEVHLYLIDTATTGDRCASPACPPRFRIGVEGLAIAGLKLDELPCDAPIPHLAPSNVSRLAALDDKREDRHMVVGVARADESKPENGSQSFEAVADQRLIVPRPAGPGPASSKRRSESQP
jgi:hypothetical protein